MDQQILLASSTLDPALSAADSLRNCEETSGQVSILALATCFLRGVFLTVIF